MNLEVEPNKNTSCAIPILKHERQVNRQSKKTSSNMWMRSNFVRPISKGMYICPFYRIILPHIINKNHRPCHLDWIFIAESIYRFSLFNYSYIYNVKLENYKKKEKKRFTTK